MSHPPVACSVVQKSAEFDRSEVKLRRQDANDDGRISVDGNRAAEHVGRAAVSLLPRGVTQDAVRGAAGRSSSCGSRGP